MPRAFTGIFDFSYAPYALGDSLTFVANVQCLARLGEFEAADIMITVSPGAPSNTIQKHAITPRNYHHALTNLFPAFLCGPQIRSISLFKNRRPFNLELVRRKMSGGGFWPPLRKHFQKRLTYWSHGPMNRAYAELGDFPRLGAPQGFEHSADDILERFGNPRIPVAVNIRQRAMTTDPVALHRDSNLDAWLGFFRLARERAPDAMFFLLGGYGEWERRLLDVPNLVILRFYGYGLAEELALLQQCRAFLGTNSGFANAAAFSAVPHVITAIEEAHATHAEIAVGAPRHPFANDDQILMWEPETPKRLFEAFAGILGG